MTAVEEGDEYADVQVQEDNELGDYEGELLGLGHGGGSDIMQRPPEGMSNQGSFVVGEQQTRSRPASFISNDPGSFAEQMPQGNDVADVYRSNSNGSLDDINVVETEDMLPSNQPAPQSPSPTKSSIREGVSAQKTPLQITPLALPANPLAPI